MLYRRVTVTPELIRAAQRGNLAAFNCLLSEYQDTIYNLVCFMFPLGQDQEVIAQKAIQRLYRDLRSYRSGDFDVWLLKTLVKDCRARLKRHYPGGHEDRSLQCCLGILPPKLRLAVVLVDMQGLSYAQAAAVLGIPRWLLCKRLAQGRRRILDASERRLESAWI